VNKQKLKERTSIPIQNYAIDPELSNKLHKDFTTLYVTKNHEGVGSVEFMKSVLGKQTYCQNLGYRYWVWEFEDYRVYASNTKGFNVEIIERSCPKCNHSLINAGQAMQIWGEFYNRVMEKTK